MPRPVPDGLRRARDMLRRNSRASARTLREVTMTSGRWWFPRQVIYLSTTPNGSPTMPAIQMSPGRPLLRVGSVLLLGSLLVLGACKPGGEGGAEGKEGENKAPEAI